MELGFSNSLRKKMSESLPSIDPAIFDITTSIDSEMEKIYEGKYDYVQHQSSKFHSLNYFLYLTEIFNEIRYAAISAECCLELSKNEDATKKDLEDLGYRFKFYVDSSIYRYYSFWEIVGRFFNEYFDLQLEVNQKNYDKEKGFYFGRDVLDKIIRDYEHKMLIEILTLYEKSKNIFEYRTLKTHKRNTRIGEQILKLKKERKPNGRTLKIDIGKEFSFNELLKLLMDSHKFARLTIEIIRKFFDLAPDEFEMFKKKNKAKSLIIIPDEKTVTKFQKIIKYNSLIIKPNKK